MINEHDKCIEKYEKFKDTTSRIIIITFSVWSSLQKDIEIYILPCQNMIFIGDFEYDMCYHINSWWTKAYNNGLKYELKESFFISIV